MGNRRHSYLQAAATQLYHQEQTNTMTNDLTSAARLQDFIDRDALVRHDWGDGYERACLLAAMVPECATAESPKACPATVMPKWLAYMTPKFDDLGSDEVWPGMVRRYAAVAARWHILDAKAWKRVHLRTLHGIVSEARQRATPTQVEVIEAIDGVLVWLAAGAPEEDRSKVQAAAWASALAAETAAAWAAAWAAETTTAAAARAAATTAWDRITDLTLTAIEQECDAAEGSSAK